ncbi:phospholipase D-like domain-containing protein [Chondromyces apiculatus]|uniref:Cardiolipin synthetase n=1 Tax=Chondromyces apiculatus DSM 436 TaxID=1192034 RepID=A0A017T0C5_9BACT|nr:phosphatidylserine/phosphatidylglycerophosphate/cardiolipin synthase family protein [Chondromyces apiculatus]EYF02694.1 Cardiolipin synthetase [Chondromyces apiculatus DSM 436]
MSVGAHRLALLRDGEQAFPVMLDAIARARETICLETYILRSDRTGMRFAEALAERAAAGVEVNLLYDAWGSSVTTSYLADLRAAGVRTLEFHPFAVNTPFAKFLRRDHRKMLVVDSHVGVTGGMNIADDYAAVTEGGGGWRDTQMLLEGPAVAELQYLFLRTWRRSGGAPLDERRYGYDGRRPDPKVRIVGNGLPRRKRWVRDEYRHAFDRAKRRIWITNAYFLPPLRMIRALGDASRRGVDVRIMVAGTTDVPAVLFASRAFYGHLLKAGAKLYEWRGRVLHAKTAVIDGRWSTVGSSNLDAQSLRKNLEVNCFVEDEGFAASMERMFQDDITHCAQITEQLWKQRSLVERAATWAAFLAREWL